MKLHITLISLGLGLCVLYQAHGAKEPRIKGGKGGKGKAGDKGSAKPTIFKTKPHRTTTPECASISLFRYQHLVAMNYTTTTTEWPEVSRLKQRIERKDRRNAIIIDILRTKFHLMTDKQKFKVEFGKFKKYIMKIGGNGTRFLKQFLEIAEKNKQFEQRVKQIDPLLKRWGIPRYEHIAHRFTYITPAITERLNYTPTAKWSKIMWFKTSVLDVRYSRVLHKINNPIRWDDLNIHTTDAWIAAVQNMPGYKHHQRKINIGLKRQRRINRTKLYYMKLAAIHAVNFTGDWKTFTGTLLPTSTDHVQYSQPDVIAAVDRYFNACGEVGEDDPWYRFHQNPLYHHQKK